MFRVNQKEVFNRVVCNEDNCEGCQYKHYYSGDDKPDWDCTGNSFDCPQVEAKKDELEAFMADNAAEFEMIEETT